MFIYEKNKINSETGKLEQTLNITFEGNKPVENPDVIVTKDGIEGIKSDSNAYIALFPNDTDKVSSYSLDGEVIAISIEQNFRTFALTFKKSVGINLTNDLYNYLYYIRIHNDTYTYTELKTTEGDSIYLQDIGEYIVDIENKILHTPTKDYNFTELSTDFNEAINNKTFIGISFTYDI
jgi:hypothetical protein